MNKEDGKILRIVALDSQAERATVMNVGKHTIPVTKLGRVVAVVGGSLCPAEPICVWCEHLRLRCFENRKA